MKTVKFYTLGCKVNQYETQSIRERFLRNGYQEIYNSNIADIYLINTCTVTHKADSDSLNLIRRAKRENSEAKIIVTGCLTELDEDKIKKQGGVSLIIKNKDKEDILNRLSRLSHLSRRDENDEDDEPTSTTNRGISYFKGHTRAFLKIQDGCNNFCSYCKVPLVRGNSRSKPLNEIIQEAEKLVKNSFKEIVLCGICLGSYGKDLQPGINLVDVISALEDIEGLLRIRLSSIEAGDVSDALIDKMAQSNLACRQTGKLCRHLHIPIQSGDDEILKKMNRKYTFEGYANLIHRIKARIPEIAITTDVMVGFPCETEENFQNTVKLIRDVIPLKVHIFPYSLRKGTAASNFKDTLNPMIIKERILRLRDISHNCSLIYKKRFLNKKMDVLTEARAKEDKGYWEGYTDNYIKTRVKSELSLENKLIPLRLKKIGKNCVLADSC